MRPSMSLPVRNRTARNVPFPVEKPVAGKAGLISITNIVLGSSL